MEELKTALTEYDNQLTMVCEALETTNNDDERSSLMTLKSDLLQLKQLTNESLISLEKKQNSEDVTQKRDANSDTLDDEYALFMEEMSKSGAYEKGKKEQGESSKVNDDDDDSDIEDELSSLLGMKCAVYHTHKWGGQPTLHNAMVSALVPRQDTDQFKDLQVQVLFTHPTHAEMLPCPFYLDGECKFSDEQCRYSHGICISLSDLKEAIVPDFASVKIGSRILMKIKPADNEDISLTKKSMEKYHLWHRAIVKSVNEENRCCTAKLEHGLKIGDKRKSGSDEYNVVFEEIFPLNNDSDEGSSSDDELSDTDYPESKSAKPDDVNRELLIEKSLENNAPAMGEWERHTRGIGSKLMLAMGYVPGTGLGAASDGRVVPVTARAPSAAHARQGLDHCLALSEGAANQDPLKVEQKLKRLQKREEERNRRAYEREKERERRNVFNFLNRTLGDKSDDSDASNRLSEVDYKQSTSKELNIQQFKVTEDVKKIEREVMKLKSSLCKYHQDSNGYKSICAQIIELNKELDNLKSKEKQISQEQRHRKDKAKMTVF